MVDVESGAGDLAGYQVVVLQTGERISADVVIGADGKPKIPRAGRAPTLTGGLLGPGLWSKMREVVLGRPMPPAETGDLAYRGTFTRAQLEAFHDERIDEMIDRPILCNWLGENKHAVFYPLRNKTEFNLVIM